MNMKSLIKAIFKKKTSSTEKNDDNIAIGTPVTFNQLFFLLNLYQWIQEKPHATNEKKEINSLIAINYFRLKKTFHFPDRSFDNFKDMNGSPINDYVDELYRVKEREGLISELNFTYILTENGQKVVEIIRRGNYYEYDLFDKSIKFFNQDLIDSIDANIGKLKNFPDNSLISTALHIIQMKSVSI